MENKHYHAIIEELDLIKQELLQDIAAIDRLLLRFQDKLEQRDIVPLRQPVVRTRRQHGEWANEVKRVLSQTGREMTVVELAKMIPSIDSQSLSTRMSGYSKHQQSLFYRVPVNKKHFAYGLSEWKKQA
jgi:hypothetical protein